MRIFKRASAGRSSKPACIEEFLGPELLDDPMVDRDELNDLLRDPSPLIPPEPPEPEYEPAPELPESAARRIAKLAGLVTALAMLCGAVVAATYLDRQRAAEETATFRPVHITGTRALVGFTPTPPAPAETMLTSAAAGGEAPQPGTPVGSDAGVEPSPYPTDPADFAEEFYRCIGPRPRDAISMLGANLRAGQSAELEHAWRIVRKVDVHELRIEPDGMVRAVVTMTTSDDERFRLTQLLRIDDGPPQAITEARLLSSRHVPVNG